MWRTVIVTRGERITVRDNWLVVYSDSSENRVPIEDLYSVVIDNRAAMISVAVLTTLAMAEDSETKNTKSDNMFATCRC